MSIATCPDCGQMKSPAYFGDGWSLTRSGELICDPCLTARRAADREPQGEALRLFTPAPNQLPGQLTL